MEGFYKFGLWAMLIAMLGDITVSWVMPLFYKGYSSMKMSISALGNPNSPVRLPFNLWMLTEGLLFLCVLPSLWKCYYEVSAGLTVALMIFTAVFAVGACIFTCFFSVNETKDVVTAASKIHGAGSVIGFMLFLFAPLLTAILSFKSGETALGIIGIVCFVTALVFFTLFVMSDKEEFAETAIASEGLWQRLELIFMYLPLMAVSIKNIMEI